MPLVQTHWNTAVRSALVSLFIAWVVLNWVLRSDVRLIGDIPNYGHVSIYICTLFSIDSLLISRFRIGSLPWSGHAYLTLLLPIFVVSVVLSFELWGLDRSAHPTGSFSYPFCPYLHYSGPRILCSEPLDLERLPFCTLSFYYNLVTCAFPHLQAVLFSSFLDETLSRCSIWKIDIGLCNFRVYVINRIFKKGKFANSLCQNHYWVHQEIPCKYPVKLTRSELLY